MTKKRTRMMKTLTCGWSHAAERPRLGGGGYWEILVQVKLSKREFIHSRGISCKGGNDLVKINSIDLNEGTHLDYFSLILLTPSTHFQS